MKIFKYQEWLKESQEVAPAAPAPAAAPAPSTDTLPEPAAPAAEPTLDDLPPMPELPAAETPATETPAAETTIENPEYDALDVARKDAIRAFKAKYEEFQNAPEDQKEAMKAELKTLFDAMNSAVDSFDSLVAKEIGVEEEVPEIEDEP